MSVLNETFIDALALLLWMVMFAIALGIAEVCVVIIQRIITISKQLFG